MYSRFFLFSSFFALFLFTSAHRCFSQQPETHLWPIAASRDLSDDEEDPFLKVIRAQGSVLDYSIVEVIDPLVEELDRIIEQTINSPVIYKDLPASGNSRSDYVTFASRKLCDVILSKLPRNYRRRGERTHVSSNVFLVSVEGMPKCMTNSKNVDNVLAIVKTSCKISTYIRYSYFLYKCVLFFAFSFF